MTGSLTGKVALVTGAMGIGAGIAKAMAAGASVVVNFASDRPVFLASYEAGWLVTAV